MTDPIEATKQRCPGCQHEIQSSWSSCRYCGHRLNRQRDLLKRSLAWVGVFVLFLAGHAAMSFYDSGMAIGYCVLVGIPLGFTFIQAVLYRSVGSPLSGEQLRKTTIWATLIVVIALIVVPLAFLILALVICGTRPFH